ncbi:MAG: HNH endonuclease [Gemmatimonadetes bacterium]|nr:HNH endonuclease [Gemmatimonadota bacterium]
MASTSIDLVEPRDAAFRRQAVDAWVAIYGFVCPGWGRLPHPAHLTADHPHPRSKGGSEYQPLEVLCRSCNSRKGTRTVPTVPSPSTGPVFSHSLISRRPAT